MSRARFLTRGRSTTLPLTPPSRLVHRDDQLDRAHFEFSSTDTGASFECERESGGFQTCASPRITPSVTDPTRSGCAPRRPLATQARPPFALGRWTRRRQTPRSPRRLRRSLRRPMRASRSRRRKAGRAPNATSTAPLGAVQLAEAVSGPGGGTHTFHVRAIDLATNVDPTEATYTWTIDSTEPETTITLGPAGRSPRTPRPSSSRQCTGATFQCSINPTEHSRRWQTCSSPRTFTSIPDGAHTLSVRATNVLGRRTRLRRPAPSASTPPLPTLRSLRLRPARPSDHRQLRFQLAGCRRDLHLQH